jgi:hypothetical protein
VKKASWLGFILWLAACSPAATPAPTLPPTQAATSTPVSPTATAVPILAPTQASTPVPSGPCDNPLVPLRVGNQWTYRSTTERGESLYTLKAVERQDGANIVILVEFSDQDNNTSVQEQVVCLDGAIEGFPLFVMDMLFGDLVGKHVNTYHQGGVYAPAYSTFAEKDWVLDWQAKYLTEEGVRIENPGEGLPLLIGQNSPILLSFQMDGTSEAVSTPAGEFPGPLKVSQSFLLPTTIGANGATLTLDTTQWYEPYVGLVRAQVDSATLDVFGLPVTVPMQSSLELVEFVPGE